MYTHLEQRDSTRPPVTLGTLQKMKQEGEKIACITCYDASFAVLCDNADADLVLVGDSLGMVLQGHDTTVPVTMDDIIYHSKAVARGLHRPFLVADLPFASYPTPDIALANSVRLMQEGGAEMVKLESGIGQLEIVEFLARHDIAVCAHLGLKPQSVHKTGGFRVQGRDDAAARRMLDNAKALESAGADIVLLECIPSELGQGITEALQVPVIGIGAGPATDGQVLVFHDLLGIYDGHAARFVKRYSNVREQMVAGVEAFAADVRQRRYPEPEHGYTMAPDEAARLEEML